MKKKNLLFTICGIAAALGLFSCMTSSDKGGGNALSKLSYSLDSVTFTGRVTIVTDTAMVTGTATHFSISPPLPSGLVFDSTTGSISGKPVSAAAMGSYVVTASGAGGTTTTTIHIAVNAAAPTHLSFAIDSAVYVSGVTNVSNTSTVTGTVTSYTVNPALPAGLTLNATTGVITGIPTATTITSGADYVVTASNATGSTSATLHITVNSSAPMTLSYATNLATYVTGTIIIDTPMVTGGVATSYTVSPALPAGLSLDAATGVITGTPTAATIASGVNFIVTASNATGSTSDTLHITINPAAPSNLSYTTSLATYLSGTLISANSPTVTGTVTSYSVSPALPAGLSLNATTGVITGTPTAASITSGVNYVVTASNVSGSTSDTLHITVNPAAPANLSYTTSLVTYVTGTVISSNTPTVTGGAATNFTVSPSLPAGLSLNATTGVISGTPTVTTISAGVNYVVTAANVTGSTATTLHITVNPVSATAPANLSYASNTATYLSGVAISSNSPTVTGTVTGYSVSPALPAGLTLNSATGIISGTPSATTVAAGVNYVVTASNATGSTSAILHITVNPGAPTNLSYAVNPATYTLGVAITPNTPTVTGTVTSYSTSPALPAGLSLNTSTGVITGTPTVTIPVITNYIITASNATGISAVILHITVNP